MQTQVLQADEEKWAEELKRKRQEGLDESAFMAAIRRRMERVVLTLDSGSHAQRVQVAVHAPHSCRFSDTIPSSSWELAPD